MSRRQRLYERELQASKLRRRRLLMGVGLGLLVGVGLMLSLDPTLGMAAGMLVALAGVWVAQRS